MYHIIAYFQEWKTSCWIYSMLYGIIISEETVLRYQLINLLAWFLFQMLNSLSQEKNWYLVPGNQTVNFGMLLLLSHFSRVRLCATPSLGCSRQEHWSGVPFPPPVHKSEKWTWSRSVVSNSSRPHELQPTRLLRPWDFPGKSTGVGAIAFSKLGLN